LPGNDSCDQYLPPFCETLVKVFYFFAERASLSDKICYFMLQCWFGLRYRGMAEDLPVSEIDGTFPCAGPERRQIVTKCQQANQASIEDGVSSIDRDAYMINRTAIAACF